MCNVRYIICEICIESWSEILFVIWLEISLQLLLTKNWEIFPNNSCITTKILIIDNNSFKLEESYTIEVLVVKICVMSDAFQLKLVLKVDSLQISLQLLLIKTWEIYPNTSCINNKILIIDNNSFKLDESNTIEALFVNICVMSDTFQVKLVLKVEVKFQS